MGVGGQRHAPADCTPGEDLVPIVQEAGWAPGLLWIGVENLTTTGIRSPYLPARSESLYRLSYPGPFTHRSTNHAQRCLTAVITREPLYSTWYGRWCLHSDAASYSRILGFSYNTFSHWIQDSNSGSFQTTMCGQRCQTGKHVLWIPHAICQFIDNLHSSIQQAL